MLSYLSKKKNQTSYAEFRHWEFSWITLIHGSSKWDHVFGVYSLKVGLKGYRPLCWWYWTSSNKLNGWDQYLNATCHVDLWAFMVYIPLYWKRQYKLVHCSYTYHSMKFQAVEIFSCDKFPSFCILRFV